MDSFLRYTAAGARILAIRFILISRYLAGRLWVNRVPVGYGISMFILGIIFADFFRPSTSSDYGKYESREVSYTTPKRNVMAELLKIPQLRPSELLEENEVLEHRVDITVRSGDTFINLLRKAGIDRQEAFLAAQALKGVYDVRSIKVGQKMLAIFSENQENGDLFFISLEIIHPHEKIVIARNEEKGFIAKKVEKKLERKVTRAGGEINSSLFQLAADLDIPSSVMMEVIWAYSFDVDFQRDIKKGNYFEVLYETFFDEDGYKVRDGEVLFSSLNIGGEDMKIYSYEAEEGRSDYFKEDGTSIRRALLKTPINGARLSSRFGMRRHPIAGYNKMHKGIDFAAPRGTPIYAAGDGVIDYIGRKGGYGKYIRIRHNSTYSTAYAHTSKYAKGMKNGRRVKQGQVIAYVGTTGRSTGPHLHYEVLQGGTQVNPLKVKMTPGKKLTNRELAKFNDTKKFINTLLAELPIKEKQIASSN